MSEAPVAIITGGAQGLGAAIAEVLLKEGYRVSVGDIQEDKGKQFVEDQQKIHGTQNVEFVFCDVTKENDYQSIFEFTLKKFHRIDVVVNNAGIVNERDARKTVDINLMGTILGCQFALRYMGKSNGGKGGMVINIASIAGFLPAYAFPAYVASKHAIIGFTRSYGHPYHLEKDAIVFSALCPSFIETAILNSCKKDSLVAEFDPYKICEPMRTEYVAKGVSKLLNDRINGSTLIVTEKLGFQYVGLQEEFKEFIKE